MSSKKQATKQNFMNETEGIKDFDPELEAEGWKERNSSFPLPADHTGEGGRSCTRLAIR